MSQNIIAEEVQFARKLASNDKRIRDKALNRLSKWFRAKKDCTDLHYHDYLRIWRGLYYCVWMTDKPLIQEEICEKVSNLVHFWSEKKNFLRFVATYFDTMRENWEGLDGLRLDKFLMFSRRFLRQSLSYIFKQEDKNILEKFSNIVLLRVLKKNKKSLGFTMHFTEMFIEEIAKVTKANIETQDLIVLLKPFIITYLTNSDSRIRSSIYYHIFINLIKQHPQIKQLEERYQAWKKAGKPGNNYMDMQLVEVDNGDNWDEESNDLSNEALDPRAGKVDVVINLIDFEPLQIVECFKSQLEKETVKPSIYRQALELCKKYELINKGEFPFGRKKFINEKKQVITNISKLHKNKVEERGFNPPEKRKLTSEENLIQNNKKIKISNGTPQLNEIYDKPMKNDLNTSTPLKNEINEKIETNRNDEKNAINKNESISTILKTEINEQPLITTLKIVSNKEKLKILENKSQKPLKKLDKQLLDRINSLKKSTIKKKVKGKSLKEREKKKINNLSSEQRKIDKKNKQVLSNMNNSSMNESLKRVSISLNLNKSQEIKDYYKKLRENPKIPYDPEKTPVCGVLKPSLPSPLNPFYKRVVTKANKSLI